MYALWIAREMHSAVIRATVYVSNLCLLTTVGGCLNEILNILTVRNVFQYEIYINAITQFISLKNIIFYKQKRL